jgi:hypothetical protein
MVGFRQPVNDGEPIAVGFERAYEVALRHLCVTDLQTLCPNWLLRAGDKGCHSVVIQDVSL